MRTSLSKTLEACLGKRQSAVKKGNRGHIEEEEEELDPIQQLLLDNQSPRSERSGEPDFDHLK